jgi:hypothetical protein
MGQERDDEDAVRPTPHQLWQQACDEHAWSQTQDGYQKTTDAITARYIELMREHGHLIPRKPGEPPHLLACGWPHR